MGITSIIYFFVVTSRWNWSLAKALPLVGLFLLFDISYFGANLLKVVDGGWITLTIALLLAISMTTWKEGRTALGKAISAARMPLDLFLADVARTKPPRIPGTAVFMSVSPVGVPGSLMHHFKLNKVLHEKIVFLSILVEEIPRVSIQGRLKLEDLGQGFYRLVAHFGFMEAPDVPKLIAQARHLGLETEPMATIYVLGRETLLISGKPGMSKWRKVLFAMMARNSMNPTNFFKLPPNQVIEIGAQVQI